MTRLPFPEPVLGYHIACLGETGAGKTHDAKVVVEHLVGEDYRVCVLDTLKSDWWGMISSADGKRPGLPFRILGGPRGHVPLPATAGKVVGELVGRGQLPLSIIDMADFGPGDPQAFFCAFAESLWKNVKGVVYLVIEEAHEIAPKERAGFGKENMAIHWAKKIATGSRSKGIRLIISSQRTQAVHNALLGSCKTMLAHSLSLPADQKPVLDWIKANVRDTKIAAEMAEDLAFLPTGTAWVACAKENYFKKIKFPPIKTFDNSATPDKDAEDFDVATAAVDQDELRALVGNAVKEAEANDPKALKTEIAKLQAQLRSTPAAAPAPAGQELEAAYARGFTDGQSGPQPQIWLDGHREGFRGGVGAAVNALLGATGTFTSAAEMLPHDMRAAGEAVAYKAPEPPAAYNRPVKATAAPPRVAAAPVRNPVKSVAPMRAQPQPLAEGLTKPQGELLQALRWWEGMRHTTVSRGQLAGKLGWKVSGSHLRNRLGECKNAGWIEYPQNGVVTLTVAGREAGPEPDLRDNLVGSIRGMLTQPQDEVFCHMLKTGETSREELAAALGWDAKGSHLRNRLGELSKLELIEYPTAGRVRLQMWVGDV